MSRGNKPSVSALPRYIDCNGAWNLEQLVPEPPTSEIADSGIRIHSVLSGGEEILSAEEQWVADLCKAQKEEVATTLDFNPFDATTITIIEKRYWYDELFSGAIDGLVIAQEKAWIYDYKTGRNPVSAQSLQMMGYAVLVAKNHKVNRVYCTIIQPLCGLPQTILFDEADLKTAEETILQLIADIKNPDAPRTPGENQCRYCRAIGICPEATALTQKVNTLSVETLTNDEIAQILPILPVVEKQAEEVKRIARERLKEGQEIPGYTLKEGRQTRTISNATGAFEALSSEMTAEAFTSACKVSITALEKAWAEATGLKGKAAKESLETSLGEFLETKTGEPMLSKVKGDA
jgi:hypothetical protein